VPRVVRARHIATLSCAALLALPATAAAGGAGDDQYQDPFADPAPQTEAPAQQQQEQPAPSAAPEAPAPQAEAAPAAGGTALPRTGADAGLTALGGGALLLAGLALRRRTADGVPH
jgi:LPXTG-motif cell wall-anchored protein